MGNFVSIPYPNRDYPIDVSWPLVGQFGVGSAFQANGNPRYNLSPYAVFDAPAVVAPGVANMTRYRGIFCGQFNSPLAGGTVDATLGGVSMYAGIEKAGLAAGFRFGEEVRVWSLSFAIAFANGGVNLTDESGFVLEPAGAAAPGWIKNGNRGMGIIFVGGAPFYVAKNVGGVGVYSESVSLAAAWPGARTDWAVVTFEIQSATSTGEAVFRLYLNDNATPVIERAWGVGTFLPDYSDPATAVRFCGHARMGDVASDETMFLAAGMRYTGGRFTLARAEVG